MLWTTVLLFKFGLRKKPVQSKLNQWVWSKDHKASKLEKKQNNHDAKIPFHKSYRFLSPDNSHFKILHLLSTSYFLLKTLSSKTTMLTNENVMILLIFHSLTSKELEGQPLHPSFALHSSPGILTKNSSSFPCCALPWFRFYGQHLFTLRAFYCAGPSKVSPQLAFPLSFLPSRFGNATEKSHQTGRRRPKPNADSHLWRFPWAAEFHLIYHRFFEIPTGTARNLSHAPYLNLLHEKCYLFYGKEMTMSACKYYHLYLTLLLELIPYLSRCPCLFPKLTTYILGLCYPMW